MIEILFTEIPQEKVYLDTLSLGFSVGGLLSSLSSVGSVSRTIVLNSVGTMLSSILNLLNLLSLLMDNCMLPLPELVIPMHT